MATAAGGAGGCCAVGEGEGWRHRGRACPPLAKVGTGCCARIRVAVTGASRNLTLPWLPSTTLQWQEVQRWWDEGAVTWQRQRREQEESWKRCEAQQRAAWEYAHQWQGQQQARGQPQRQAQEQEHQASMPRQAPEQQQAGVQRQAGGPWQTPMQWEVQGQQQRQAGSMQWQAQQAQAHLGLPNPPQQPAQELATPEQQQSGSGTAPPSGKADSCGPGQTGSSGRAPGPRPRKRQACSGQLAREVRSCVWGFNGCLLLAGSYQRVDYRQLDGAVESNSS